MTKRTHKKGHNCRIGVISSVAAVLLAGCVTTADTNEQISVVRVISDRPVHLTISASDVHEAKTNGTSVLALPDAKLSRVEADERLTAEQRLASLQSTVKPAVPTKASAFATLSNGPLTAPEIKALFLGLETTTNEVPIEVHRFGHLGQLEGEVVSGTDIGIRPSNGTSYEDSASWIVTKKSQLCMDWFDWYSGDPACFRVIKRGKQIVLTGTEFSIHYEIRN